MLKKMQSDVIRTGFRARPSLPCGAPEIRVGLAMLVGALFSAPAAAQFSETFHPFASVAVNHDDNLFRVTDARAATLEHASDTYRSVFAGLLIDLPVERQQFNATLKLSRVTFENNDQLNYNGKDLSGDWRWVLGNQLNGRIGGSYTEVLAPFEDFPTVSGRNIRKVRKQYANGNWRFHPSWQLRAGVTEDRYTYELVSQRLNNRTERSTMAGADYLASSGSTIGVQLRRLKGSYPYQSELGFADNGYTQDEQKINILWLVTGSTQVMFLGGWVQRKHNFYTARDEDGTNGRLITSWAPEPNIKLTGQLYREFGAIEGALVNSALVKGATVGATWDATAKIQASANLKHEKRDFSPYSNSGVVLSGDQMSDSSNQVSLGVVYKPLRTVSLQASVFRDRRSGSAAAGTNTFTANGASLSATLQF